MKYGMISSMTVNHWHLMLRKEHGDVAIENFKTRREAQEEIENRSSVTLHLGTNPKEIYYVKRAGRKRYSSGGLQNRE